MDGMGGELLAMRRIRGDAYVREPRDACWSNASHLLMLTLSCRILYHACATRNKKRKEEEKRKEKKKKREEKRRGEEEKRRKEKKRENNENRNTSEWMLLGCTGQG